jgi:hypothetical protein
VPKDNFIERSNSSQQSIHLLSKSKGGGVGVGLIDDDEPISNIFTNKSINNQSSFSHLNPPAAHSGYLSHFQGNTTNSSRKSSISGTPPTNLNSYLTSISTSNALGFNILKSSSSTLIANESASFAAGSMQSAKKGIVLYPRCFVAKFTGLPGSYNWIFLFYL